MNLVEQLNRIGTSRNVFRLGDDDKHAPTRVICFPPSGATLRDFRTWPAHLAGLAEVVGFMMPGRLFRLRDPLQTDLCEMARDVADDLVKENLLDKPYMLFGSSMGGLVAYECARRLMERGQPRPLVLGMASTPAPHVVPMGGPVGGSDELMRQRLLDLGLNLEKLEGSPTARALLWRAMRADVIAFDTYRHEEPAGPLLDIPLHLWVGMEDTVVTEDYALQWEKYVRPDLFHVTYVPAGHLYVEEKPDYLFPPITHYLRGLRKA